MLDTEFLHRYVGSNDLTLLAHLRIYSQQLRSLISENPVLFR